MKGAEARMDVSEARRSSSSSLVDHVAHEVHGMVRKDEHISGDPTAPVGQEVERQVDDSIVQYLGARNDTIRLGYANDAAAVGLARSLYEVKETDGERLVCPFADAEAAKRPGMNPQSATNFANQLDSKADAGLKPVLKSRADDGFLAGVEAHATVRMLPKEEQPAAAAKWLQTHYGNRLGDVAFTTGVNYQAYLQGTGGKAAVDAEAHDIGQRYAIEHPLVGTIAG